MTNLPEKPTVKDFAKYIKETCEERSFLKNERGTKFAHLLEEAGELASACRKFEKGKTTKEDIELESADVFMFLLDICNHYDVDLEDAFRKKEEINKKRTF